MPVSSVMRPVPAIGVARVDHQVHDHLLQAADVDLDLVRVGASASLTSRFSPTRLRIIGAIPSMISFDADDGRVNDLLARERQQLLRQRGAAPRRLRRALQELDGRRAARLRPRARSMKPSMDVSRLLKSWATPPASRPMLSSFCDCRSCSCRRASISSDCFRWVMLVAHSVAATTSPPSMSGPARTDHHSRACRPVPAGPGPRIRRARPSRTPSRPPPRPATASRAGRGRRRTIRSRLRAEAAGRCG